MGVRLGRLLLALAVLGSVAPAGAHASPRLDGRCHLKGAHAAAESRYAVILKRGALTWGCLKRTGVERPLEGESGMSVNAARLNRWFAGYQQDEGCFDRCIRMNVVDLRSGSRRVSYAANDFDYPALRAFVIDGRGRAAWIRAGNTGFAVFKMDSDGDTMLDSGPDLDPRSLRIGPSRVSWRRAGATRSSALDAHPRCSGENTSTLEENAEARVYWKREAIVGCLRATQKRTSIGGRDLDTFEYTGGGFVHLAGHFASIDNGSAGRGGGAANLDVVDLSTGAVVHHWECCFSQGGGDGGLGAVVVAPTGAVAWIGWSSGRDGKPLAEVRKSDADGEAIVLDSDPDGLAFDRTSLRLEGHTLTWVHHGQTRSAELR